MNLVEKERACAQAVSRVMIEAAKNKKALEAELFYVDHLAEMKAVVGEMHASIQSGEWWKKLLVLIFYPLLVVLMLVLSFVDFISRSYRYLSKTFELNRHIKSLQTASVPVVSPPHKSILALWEGHGIPRHFNQQLTVSLLAEWLSILYPPELIKDIQLEAKSKDIVKTAVNINEDYYLGESSIHILMCPSDITLVDKVSRQLPDYGAVSENGKNRTLSRLQRS